MTDALKSALDRQTKSWQAARGSPPQAPWDPDIDPAIYQGEQDAQSWIGWLPLIKESGPTLAESAPDLAPFHPSIEAYFGRYWFLGLEGKLGELMVSLRPNRPGLDPDAYLQMVRRYASGNRPPLKFVPIGIDNNSSLPLVVDNLNGRILVEDWERGEQMEVARSLDDLLSNLQV